MLCTYAMHKIDFLKDTDKYNPFSSANFKYSVEIYLDDNVHNDIVNLVVCQDLMSNKLVEIKHAKTLSSKLLSPVKNYNYSIDNITEVIMLSKYTT